MHDQEGYRDVVQVSRDVVSEAKAYPEVNWLKGIFTD